MDDLIEALTIFKKYTDTEYPTNCNHDELAIMDVSPSDVSEYEVKRLKELGFFVADEDGDEYFMSFRFGSA